MLAGKLLLLLLIFVLLMNGKRPAICVHFAFSSVCADRHGLLGNVNFAGLVSDAFHLSFGCGVLTFSLFAMTLADRPPDKAYTYGYMDPFLHNVGSENASIFFLIS